MLVVFLKDVWHGLLDSLNEAPLIIFIAYNSFSVSLQTPAKSLNIVT